MQGRKNQHRYGANRGDDAGAGNLPLPQQYAEACPERTGGGKQQIAADTMRADGQMRFKAEHRQTGSDGDAAEYARRRWPFAQHHGGQNDAAQRRGRRLNGGAVAERYEDETGIGDQRLRRPGQQGHDDAAAPADAAEVLDAVAQHQRHQQQAGPQKAMQRQIGRRKTDFDAVFGDDETGGPGQGGARAAQGADQHPGKARRLWLNLGLLLVQNGCPSSTNR